MNLTDLYKPKAPEVHIPNHDAVFVFHIADTTENDIEEGITGLIITIGTSADWESYHVLSDNYTIEDYDLLRPFLEEVNMTDELMESVYNYTGLYNSRSMMTYMLNYNIDGRYLFKYSTDFWNAMEVGELYESNNEEWTEEEDVDLRNNTPVHRTQYGIVDDDTPIDYEPELDL